MRDKNEHDDWKDRIGYALPIKTFIGLYANLFPAPRSEQVDPYTSSVEIGTPSKDGKIKVYFDPGNVEESKNRMHNAVIIREFGLMLSEEDTRKRMRENLQSSIFEAEGREEDFQKEETG